MFREEKNIGLKSNGKYFSIAPKGKQIIAQTTALLVCGCITSCKGVLLFCSSSCLKI